MCVCLCARPARSPAPSGWGCGAGVCAWAWVAAVPRHTWLGCWACVCSCARPARTPPLLAAVCGVGVCASAWVSAVPRHSWLGCLGVCVLVRVPRFYPAIPGGVVCVCVVSGFSRSPVFSWLECWGASPLVCAVSAFRHLLGGLPVAWGCAGVAVGWVCPPPPLLFFFQAAGGMCGFWPCRVVALWCPSLAVPVLALVVPIPPCRLVWALPSFFFCPSLPQRGVCWRVWGVLSSRGVLLCVGCRRFWLGGPPVFLRGAPWVPSSVPSGWGVCPPLVVWVGSFVAVGLSRAPPPLSFLGGVCLLLPLPSLGWCTHWSAFGVVDRVAVGACVLLGLAPAPWDRWVMYRLGSVALLVD